MILRLVLVFAFLCPPVLAGTLQSSQGTLRLTKMAEGFDVPWALAFLPGGGFLVTERDGRLILVRDGARTRIKGVPRVAGEGQGGLLDVLVPRDFPRSREIFLTFSKRQGRGTGTAVARARLSEDRSRLQDVRVIFEAAPSSTTNRHYGSRLAEAPDGSLFVTLGERGQRDSAQNLGLQQGSVIRISRDGSVPADNPFLTTPNAKPEIWSYGHRNPQGMAFDAQGRLWAVEHGAKGGDEVNLIRRGRNYGWPVISYGTHYSGRKIGEGTAQDGMEQPSHYWDPSIAPSGLMVYSGKLWPQWRGHIFIGSLKFDHISRLSGSPLKEREKLEGPETGRIRDVREAPDGSIWFASETEGAIFRLSK
jgi:glucose/arabinose dehydrogenase